MSFMALHSLDRYAHDLLAALMRERSAFHQEMRALEKSNDWNEKRWRECAKMYADERKKRQDLEQKLKELNV